MIYALDQEGILAVGTSLWEDFLAKVSDPELRLLVLHSNEPLPGLFQRLQTLDSMMSYPVPVFLTTHDHSEERADILAERGAVRVIFKPYDIRSFVTIIKEKFFEEIEGHLLYQEIKQKEQLLTDLIKTQEHAVLMEEVNREILWVASLAPKGTGEIIVFAVDRELRYVYFTPDHAAGMKRLFGRPLELGLKITDFPWPPTFLDLVQKLGKSFEGEDVEADFQLVFDMQTLSIHSRSRPLKLEDGSIFGAVIGMHNRFSEEDSNSQSVILLDSHYELEWGSLVLKHLPDLYVICDKELRILFITSNQKGLPSREYFIGKPLTDFLEDPSDWKVGKEPRRRRLAWAIPGLARESYWVSVTKIQASLRHQAEYLVILQKRRLKDKVPNTWMRILWDQKNLPIEVFNSHGSVLDTNPARKAVFGGLTKSLAWPHPPGLSSKSLEYRGLSFRVVYAPAPKRHKVVALFLPESLAKTSRWLEGAEIVGLIAHQWRQPLANLSALFNVLELKASQVPDHHEDFLPKISHAQKLIQHLSSTIDDFRQYLSTEHQKQPTDLVALCHTVYNLFSERITALDVVWEWDIREQPLLVIIHRGLVFQALIELTRNSLAALQSVSKPPRMTWVLGRLDQKAVLEVHHTGRPFPPQILDKLQRGKKFDHVGQGLKYIRKVVEKIHGGLYEVEQTEDDVAQKLIFPGVGG